MPATKTSHPYLQISRDLFFVLRGIWVLLLFHSLAILAFIFLPQGTDTLLLLLENSFQGGNPLPLAFLVLGVFFWSISSEFCARMLLNMTDNSGHALSVASVRSRKQLQVFLASCCLYLPILVMAIGLVKAYLQNQSDSHFPLGVLLALLFVLATSAWLLYQLYHAPRKFRFCRKWMQLSSPEAYWTGKLYGIFNPYRIDLPLGIQLLGQPAMTGITDADLPRETPLPNGSYIPAGFILVEKGMNHHPFPVQTWIYQIPFSFYHSLLRQLLTLFAIALVLIVVFSLLPYHAYPMVGAAALVCSSFACWQLVYTFLLFLDRAQPLGRFILPYRFLVLCWLVFCSYQNQDHPVRVLQSRSNQEQPTIDAHFEAWVGQLEKQTDADSIPVYLVAAEGGALRTGAFTAMTLSKIADTHPGFSERIYAYSTVSGGSLGAGFFESIQGIKKRFPNQLLSPICKRFFELDFLSALTGKLVFAEIIQCFIPWHLETLDRAIALEQAWELGWETATSLPKGQNHFAQAVPASRHDPAMLFQTVEAETGLPCFWTNLNVAASMPLSNERNLAKRYPVAIALSSAINLSARFPLLSPAAKMDQPIKDGQIRRHYVDGGYFDNSGQENLYQLIQTIPFEKHPRLQVKILCFNFSTTDTGSNKGIRLGNEFTEIIQAAYQTRNARTQLASENLRQYCLKRFGTGHLLELNLGLTTRNLPMNWVLSHTAMQRVDAYCNNILEQIKPFISSPNKHP